MGNALHYTQIKKSDLKFEPFAEYLAEEGDWLDITIISDSPLLEHDAMYMMQHYDKARQRLLEIRARDERRVKLARESGMTPEQLEELEKQAKEDRKNSEQAKEKATVVKKAKADQKTTVVRKKKNAPKAGKMMDLETKSDDDDDLF